MKRLAIGFCFVVTVAVSGPAQADLIDLVLTGNGGMGLLPENVTPPTSSTGSGGIGSTGIIFNTDTNILHVDMKWGSENGFSDLTGDVTLLHMHGPVDLPPDGWSQVTTNIIINMGNSLNFDPTGDGGGIIEDYFLSDEEATWLLDGRTYINVHTKMYEFGEIRGYLRRADAIPEPGVVSFFGLLAFAVFGRRRRKLI